MLPRVRRANWMLTYWTYIQSWSVVQQPGGQGWKWSISEVFLHILIRDQYYLTPTFSVVWCQVASMAIHRNTSEGAKCPPTLPRKKSPFPSNNNLQTDFWYTRLPPLAYFRPLATWLQYFCHILMCHHVMMSWCRRNLILLSMIAITFMGVSLQSFSV